jgi:hypothetical protein
MLPCFLPGPALPVVRRAHPARMASRRARASADKPPTPDTDHANLVHRSRAPLRRAARLGEPPALLQGPGAVLGIAVVAASLVLEYCKTISNVVGRGWRKRELLLADAAVDPRKASATNSASSDTFYTHLSSEPVRRYSDVAASLFRPGVSPDSSEIVSSPNLDSESAGCSKNKRVAGVGVEEGSAPLPSSVQVHDSLTDDSVSADLKSTTASTRENIGRDDVDTLSEADDVFAAISVPTSANDLAARTEMSVASTTPSDEKDTANAETEEPAAAEAALEDSLAAAKAELVSAERALSKARARENRAT